MGSDSRCYPFWFARSLILLLAFASLPAWSQISFDKPDIDVGRGPVSIAQADFNGDGLPDLVTANSTDNTVTVLLNKGDGTFHRQDYSTALHPNVVVAADFNGDGIPDVAVGGDTGIAIFFGMKDGGLSRVAFIATPNEVTGMVAADFNGHGHLDLATVQGRTGVVSIYTGTGSTTFFHVGDYATAVGSSSVGFPSTMVAADFNGDGVLDLAVANGNSLSVAIFLGLGHAAFISAPDIVTSDAALVSVAGADFDRDGHADLTVTTEYCDHQKGGGCYFIINIYAGQGDGSFVQQGRDNVGSTASLGAPAILDLDGDGIPDIAASILFAGVGVGITDPQRPFFTRLSAFFPAGLGVVSLAAADFNGDGIPDIATANSVDDTVTILLSDGHGKLRSHLRTELSFALDAQVLLADVNGDGVLDLVLIHPNVVGFEVAFGHGDGTFSDPKQSQPDFMPWGIIVADLNHDGIPDVVLTGVDGSIGPFAALATRVLLGKGDGTFSKAFQFPEATFPGRLVTADFNGDGVLDIGLLQDNIISIALGNGDGTFRTPIHTTIADAGFSATGMALGDFDGDGKVDLIIGDEGVLGFPGPPTVKLFHGNGDGTFRAGQTLATLSDGLPVADDFNRDGILDFVVYHVVPPQDSVVTLFLGNGDGTFRRGPDLPADRKPGANGVHRLQIADLNNDGFPDLVISNDRISVMMNNGDGTFKPRQDFAIGGVGVLAIADFTGDGKPDIFSFGFQDLVMLVNTTGAPHPDFKFTLHSSEVSLSPGQSQAIHGTLAGLGAFDHGISFSCAGLPLGASCKFDPPNFALSADATAPMTLTIITTGPMTAPRAQLVFPGELACLILPLGIVVAGLRKRSRLKTVIVSAVLLALLFVLQGCATGIRPIQETTPSFTPAGAYTVTVTALSDGPEKTAHTQTIRLTVH